MAWLAWGENAAMEGAGRADGDARPDHGHERATWYFAGGAGPKSTGVPKAKAVVAKTKRKPLSPEQRTAMLERLAKARAARAAK